METVAGDPYKKERKDGNSGNGRGRGKNESQRTSKARYDTDLIHREAERLVAAYLADAGRESGQRRLWTCPRCNKPTKLSLQYTTGSVGCLNANCEVPTATDVIKLIGYFEGLETRGRDFVRICELSYEMLGLENPEETKRPAKTTGAEVDAPSSESSASSFNSSITPAASTAPKGWKATRDNGAGASLRDKPPDPATPELIDAVLTLLLENCPPENRDLDFWDSRGVWEKTVVEGRFGSMSPDRCAYVLGKLESSFGRDRLLGVPGFREDSRGRLGFTLWGDFALIPYFDGDGRVRTIEGRAIGEPPPWGGKYVSLRGGGNHLYVFPSFSADDLVAFCEGPIGAILAAQHGIPVGSIQGVKRYRSAGEEATLPELAGTDFKGREVAYIPDLDVKEAAKKDVEEHLPHACEYLIGRQNGLAQVVVLPEGKDLDEYLILFPEEDRKSTFYHLIATAVSPQKWLHGTPDPSSERATEEDETVHPRDDSPSQARPAATEVTGEAEAEQPEKQWADEREAAPQHPVGQSAQDTYEETSMSPHGDMPEPAEEPQTEAVSQGAVLKDDGPEALEEDVTDEPDEREVYDRWYLGAAGYEATRGNSIPYCPPGAEPVLPAGIVGGYDLVRAAVGGALGTFITWFIITLWTSSDLGLLAMLPPPPEPTLIAGGLFAALIVGGISAVAVIIVLAGRRRIFKKHLRGDDVR